MAGTVFINYRRADSISTAGRLHDRLAQAFGRKNLFMDVDHIPAGVDFVDYLHQQVAACDVLLVVIGPNWLDGKDERGRRRLDNPDDFVAIEIAAALARNVRVIPVLVDGARMPDADSLPDAIKPLARRNAVELRNTQFGRDADALVSKIGEAFKHAPAISPRQTFSASAAGGPAAPRRWRMVAAGAIALLLLGWIALYQAGVPAWMPWTPGANHPDASGADNTKAAADAEARRQADEDEQRARAAKADEERSAKAAAEAQRQADEAEQRRLAAEKADQERRAKAAADAEAQRKAEQQRLATASALVHQSYAALNSGDYGTAIATASQAIYLNPNSAPAFVNRGAAYSKIGDDRAFADLNEAIRLDPSNSFAFLSRGLAYGSKGYFDRAIADYDEAIRLNPSDFHGFFRRGIAYQRKGDIDRAIANFNDAIRLNSSYASAFNDRGLAYATKGYIERAIADYSEAIRLDPNFALAYCNRGGAKLRLRDPSGKADIAKGRDLNPSACR